jgi:hypothetical protein
MPRDSIWSRITGQAIDLEEWQRVRGHLVCRRMLPATQPGGCHLNLDGGTLKGLSLSVGASHGAHLLAAFLPQEGACLDVYASDW